MAKGEQKKGRENRKPKQSEGKSSAKSAYQVRQGEVTASPYPFKNKQK